MLFLSGIFWNSSVTSTDVKQTQWKSSEWADLWSGFDGLSVLSINTTVTVNASVHISDLNKLLLNHTSVFTHDWWCLISSNQSESTNLNSQRMSKFRVWFKNTAARNTDHHPLHTQGCKRAPETFQKASKNFQKFWKVSGNLPEVFHPFTTLPTQDYRFSE